MLTRQLLCQLSYDSINLKRVLSKESYHFALEEIFYQINVEFDSVLVEVKLVFNYKSHLKLLKMVGRLGFEPRMSSILVGYSHVP